MQRVLVATHNFLLLKKANPSMMMRNQEYLVSSRLHQLEVSYNPNEDRLLLRIYTQDFKEIPLWFTRRLVKTMWPGLLKLVTMIEKNPEQVQKESKKVTKRFEQEQEQKQSITKQYATKVTKKPLSSTPLLVTMIQGKPLDKQSVVLSFKDEKGKHIEIVANSFILLSLCKLLHEAVSKAGWDLDLEF